MLLLVPLLGGSVGFSRMILGVHSLDQVVYGWLIGVWFALTFHFCVHEPLLSTCKAVF